MKDARQLYHGYRFPPEIISHTVWLYCRSCLSLRDVEGLLAEHGMAVSYEPIRQWCNRFGPEYTRKLKKRQGLLGDSWYRAEVSHEPTRQRERQMRWFKSAGQVQRFPAVYDVVGNLFRLGRHLIRATHYLEFRSRAFREWQEVTCAQIMA